MVFDTDLYTAFTRQNTRASLSDVPLASFFDGSVLHRRKLAGQRKLSKASLDARPTWFGLCVGTPIPYVRNTACNNGSCVLRKHDGRYRDNCEKRGSHDIRE
jgi:hypothetical protein